MKMENSSSRSPDSSCPDYYAYAPSLERATRDQSSGSSDSLISSSTGNNMSNSSSFRIHFQSNLGNNERNQQISEDFPRSQSYSNGKSVISFAAVGKNDGDERFRPTPENSTRGQNYQNGGGSILNFPAVESNWHGSSSIANTSHGLSSPANYQSSPMSSGGVIDNFYKISDEQAHISHNTPSYAKPELPYFFGSTSSTLSASKSTADTVPFPKTEKSHVSSSVSSYSTYSSVPSSNTNYANSNRQEKPNTLRLIPKTLRQSYVPTAEQQASLHNVTKKIINFCEKPSEKEGLKRKSSVLNSDYLLSTPSSSSNYRNREQDICNNSKKNKGQGSSYLEIDDDIQIIMPEVGGDSHSNSNLLAKGYSSSASSSSWSAANYHKPSVISGGSSLRSVNAAKQTKCKRDQNRLLDSQSSSQTDQERYSISNPLSSQELDEILESVWSDLDEIATSADVTSAAGSPETITIPLVSEEDDSSSSSSSIVSIHEVQIDSNAFDKSKSPSPILEKVHSDISSPITVDDSSKNVELQELKVKQAAENVKEDFKKLLEDELICNICTELLIKPITLGCSHTFCKFCICEWKEKKRQCPMCRASIITETPCLFLDNFISKAVEQLDPASVEKRLEIIKNREEQQKSKVCKPPVQLSRPSNLPQTQFRALNSIPTFLDSIPTFLDSIPQVYSNYLPRSSNIHPQTSNILQQSMLLRRSSNLLHRSSNILRRSLNIPLQTSIIPQRSSIIPQQSSSIPQQSSSIPQQPSNIPQPLSNPFYWNGPFYRK